MKFNSIKSVALLALGSLLLTSSVSIADDAIARSTLLQKFNEEVMKAGDNKRQHLGFREIRYKYFYTKTEWLPDLESFYINEYKNLRNNIGTKKEKKILFVP